MATQQLQLVGRTQVLWQQCWDPKVCVDIPFDGTKCIGAHFCVRIIEDGGTFYLEVEINGNSARFALADGCIPTYSVGIAHLDVCVTPAMSGGHLSGVTLTVKACVGGDIGPIHLQKCWDLYHGTIHFDVLTEDHVEAITGLRISTKAGNRFIAASESATANLTAQVHNAAGSRVQRTQVSLLSDDTEVLPNKDGTPHMFQVGVFVRQPNPVPQSAVDDNARSGLRNAAQQFIDQINNSPVPGTPTLSLAEVHLDHYVGLVYETHVDPLSQESHSQATGTAFGTALVKGL